jgi:hypothetical protein
MVRERASGAGPRPASPDGEGAQPPSPRTLNDSAMSDAEGDREARAVV